MASDPKDRNPFRKLGRPNLDRLKSDDFDGFIHTRPKYHRNQPPFIGMYEDEYLAAYPSHPVAFLRWSQNRSRLVAPALDNSVESLNRIFGAVLNVCPYNEIKLRHVVRYLVCNWSVIRSYVPMRGGFTPCPEDIYWLYKHRPMSVDEVLRGLFGKRLQDRLEARMRLLRYTVLEEKTEIDSLYDKWRRLLAFVPLLREEEFLDALDGVVIGRAGGREGMMEEDEGKG